jgi:hypothetical protein
VYEEIGHVATDLGHHQYLQFRRFKNADRTKKNKKSFSVVLKYYSPLIYYCATKWALHLPHAGGYRVRVVQGAVRALFYTKFTRKKGTLLSLGECTPPTPPPKSAPALR